MERLDVHQAAAKKGISIWTIRAGIGHADPNKRLKAYIGKNGRHEIEQADLDAWWATARLVQVKNKRKRAVVEPVDGGLSKEKSAREFIGGKWL